MFIEIDDLPSRNFALIHYQSRFVLFDVTKGVLIVSGSFTEKWAKRYLIDELGIASDDSEGVNHVVDLIALAKSDGHSLGHGSFDDCIRNNRYGANGAPLNQVQFETRFFLKGKKAKVQLYMCDMCFEAVHIPESHPEYAKFADNGGSQAVSDYCETCSWEKIITH
ncbi:MAG: hypothetical protein ACRC1W_00280 [Shewanella sp.]